MSPRRHRRSPDAARNLDEGQVRRGVEGVQAWGDGEYAVRAIPGGSATKAYRCPGCDHEIAPGVAHVVAWPADGLGGPADRRHWHTGCWRARDRRTPNIQRSRSAPRYG
ncbi:hypothetical protein HC028_06860 [Planosporangium flavigriseum]|uniref:ATP/GTP-binding protein n=1 Tax=Planosporangium flavigriseum TaxID=373681 RepID=A0A8J3LP50_9ACTN|nr:hypothetical protein [Planosporangium flavigriseum]NJC64232.1 hypothetical protein [Planosporangium flavigriseum]GIG74285.1 hypothetical protein Pfl04_26890 [Planosporangium flavigriseum]